MSDRGVRPCYIHAGTHKTGTTSIQHHLWHHRDALGNLGILYPLTGCPFFGNRQTFGHHNIAWELNHDWRFDPEQGTYRALLDEMAGSDAKVAVLSSEVFSLLCARPDVLGVFARDLRAAAFSPKVVVYLRARADYATSLYGALVRSGRLERSFGDFLLEIEARGYFLDGQLRYYLRYADMLVNFERAFGAENMIVRPFARSWHGSRVLEDVLSVIDPEQRIDRTLLPAERFNEASSFIELLQYLYRNVAPTFSDSAKRDVEGLLAAVRSETATEGWPSGPFDLLDDDEVRRLEESFSDDDAEILRRYGCSVEVTRALDLGGEERAAKAARRRTYEEFIDRSRERFTACRRGSS